MGIYVKGRILTNPSCYGKIFKGESPECRKCLRSDECREVTFDYEAYVVFKAFAPPEPGDLNYTAGDELVLVELPNMKCYICMEKIVKGTHVKYEKKGKGFYHQDCSSEKDHKDSARIRNY